MDLLLKCSEYEQYPYTGKHAIEHDTEVRWQ